MMTALAGMTVRTDLLGVTSMVRALGLRSLYYDRLLDFFHSSALDLETLTRVWRDLVLLNLATLISFSLFFVAVYLPLGAGLNAFVFHGTSPIFTALVGALLLKESLSGRFWL